MSSEDLSTRTVTVSHDRSSDADRPSPLEPPPQFGSFRVERLLGAGGMGAVYAAIDVRFGGHVALKTVGITVDRARLQALKAEFRSMGDFSHPNVVQIYGMGIEPSGWYCVMELIEGVDLISAFGSPVDRSWLLRSFRQLALGLHALHRAGWIHRDLKSSNVMVERDTGRVVILDFGLARAMHETGLDERARFATPSHTAPEVLRGAPASRASDWYAFGVLLGEAIAGRRLGTEPRASLEEVARSAGGELRPLVDLALSLLDDEPARRGSAETILHHLGVRSTAGVGSASPSLVGREGELTRLERVWETVREGETAIVEIEGPGGAGKTALVEHFVRKIAQAGAADVLRSRCHAHEQVPFKAVDPLVESMLALATARAVAAGPQDAPTHVFGDPLRTAQADRASPPVGDRIPSAQRRVEAFSELKRVLDALRAVRPVVLFIDDAHLGDADSAQLLRAILQARDGAPCGVLLLLTLRPGGEQAPFFAEARRCRLTEVHRSERIVLSALDPASAIRLARTLVGSAEAVDDQELADVVQEARGNPLLVIKAAQAISAIKPASERSLLETLVEADLQAVAPSTRRLADVLAIARAPLPLDVAARAIGEPFDVYRAVAALRRAKLLTFSFNPVEDDDGVVVELYHEQFRDPVLRHLDASARTPLHRDLARALAAEPTHDAGVVAAHYFAAGEPSEASRYAESAAENARQALAFLTAAEQFKNALAWGSRRGEEHRRLQIAMADALYDAGHCAEAARAYADARGGLTASARPDLTVKQATAWFGAGHVDRAFDGIRPLLASMRVSPPHQILFLPVLLAKLVRLRLSTTNVRLGAEATDPERALRADICWAVGQGASMFLSKTGIYYGVQSLIEACACGDGHRIGRAFALVGGICVNLGGPLATWGETCLTRSEAYAAERDDPYVLGWCNVWRANAHLVAGRFDEAIGLADRGVELIERGPYGMSWECHTARCFALMARERRGDLAGVAARAAKVVAQAETRDDLYGKVVFTLFLAYTAFAGGDPDRARSLAREAMERWTRDAFTIQHFYALRIETYCDLYEGDDVEAFRRLDRQWSTVRKSDVATVPSSWMEALALRAHTSLAMARRGPRERHLRGAEKAARAMARLGREAGAHAALIEASVSMLRDRRSRGARQAQAAAAGFEGLGMPLWSATARLAAGAAAGQEQGGGEPARTALLEHGIAEPARWLDVMCQGFAW
jgi:tetratricopeptide (TPR) repeat protein